MNESKKKFSTLSTIVFLGALLAAGSAFGDNQNAAKGKDKHRTWSVYLGGAASPIAYLEFKEGDAFRLTTKDANDKVKFKLVPLRKMGARWGAIKFVDFDNAADKNLLCGQVKVKKDADGKDVGPWLAIDTKDDDTVTLGWAETKEDCHAAHMHPGHAKAEN